MPRIAYLFVTGQFQNFWLLRLCQIVLLFVAAYLQGCKASAPPTLPLDIVSPWGGTQKTLTLANDRLAILVVDPNWPMNDTFRFDRSGVIVYAVTDDGRSLFGPIVPVDQHDRRIDHHIAGTAEEFDLEGPASYALAKPGEPFVKIGVGVLRRMDDNPYVHNVAYEPIYLPPWHTEQLPGRINFTQELDAVGTTGIAYIYRKVIALDDDGRGFRIERELSNCGDRLIDTLHYNHQYFILDGQPVGNGYRLDADCILGPGEPFRDRNYKYGHFVDGDFVFVDPPDPNQSLWGRVVCVDGRPLDHFRLWLDPAEYGVSVRSDRQWERFVLYALPPAISPEGFTRLRIQPGDTVRWSLSYRLLSHPSAE